MKRNLQKILIPAVLLVALCILGACQTTSADIAEDLSPMEMFQLGQEAVNDDQLQRGLAYYETFLERYPADAENGVIAEYWAAFIHHKMGDDATAIERFNLLLDQEASLAGRVPDWPFILAKRVLEELGAPRGEISTEQPE